MHYSVVDLRGAQGTRTPRGYKILSNSCSFGENLAKSYVGGPLERWCRHLEEILNPPLLLVITWDPSPTEQSERQRSLKILPSRNLLDGGKNHKYSQDMLRGGKHHNMLDCDEKPNFYWRILHPVQSLVTPGHQIFLMFLNKPLCENFTAWCYSFS